MSDPASTHALDAVGAFERGRASGRRLREQAHGDGGLRRLELPADAPFTAEQRGWLAGFLGTLLGLDAEPVRSPEPAGRAAPWRDAELSVQQRLRLAASRPLEDRLLAALAQLDCGQCGTDCAGYAAAIGSGREPNLALCLPGGRDTATALRSLLATRDDRPATALRLPVVPKEAPLRTVAPVAQSIRTVAVEAVQRGASRDVRLVTLDLAGVELRYTPGDYLAIAPQNEPDVVRRVLRTLGVRGQEEVLVDGARVPVWKVLLEERELTSTPPELFRVLAACARSPDEAATLTKLSSGLESGPDLLAVLKRYPSARPRIDELVGALGPMLPRPYPIATSPRRAPDRLEFVAMTPRGEMERRSTKGLANRFLAERLREGEWLPAFVQRSSAFALPEDGLTPIIMIGTGVAATPYRAFLQDREAQRDKGRNWLFYGSRHRKSDFFFESEWVAWKKSNLLTRLECAFSRDQADRVYLQDKLREHAVQLWRWLVDGATLYVAGDAHRLLPAIDDALLGIVVEQGRMGPDEARAYLDGLRRDRRYLRDPY